MLRLIAAILPMVALAQPTGIEAKAQTAKQAMEAGRYDQAAALYRELVRALPANGGIRMNLGLALYSEGQYREAVINLRVALKQDPNLTPALMMLGMSYLKLGQPTQAIAPLEKFVSANPIQAGIRFELASAYLEARRPAEAMRHFKKLTESDPSQPKPWQGLALSYIALSQAAFGALETAAPQSGYRSILLARSAFARGQTRSAMRLYRAALTRTPDVRGAHQGLADAFRRTGHLDRAEEEEERERKLPPPNCAVKPLECEFSGGRFGRVIALTANARTPEALYWRSRAYSALADEALARLSAMPPSSAIHELLAEAARLRGDLDTAAAEWEQALKLAPDDVLVKKGLARVLWLKRDPSARELLEQLVRGEPGSAELNFELGDSLIDDDTPRALTLLQKALKLAPGHLGAEAALGRAYVRLEKPALAIPHLKAALAMDTDGKLYYQLARAYSQTGQEELSRAAMAKYRDLYKAARERRPAMDEDERVAEP